MKPYVRSDRVSGQIHKVVSAALLKRIKDPRLAMATITDVKLSPDLKTAKIFFIFSGDQNSQESVMEGFCSAQGFIKRTLARQLGLRYMPRLNFYYDESFDYGSQIDQLIESIHANDEFDNRQSDDE